MSDFSPHSGLSQPQPQAHCSSRLPDLAALAEALQAAAHAARAFCRAEALEGEDAAYPTDPAGPAPALSPEDAGETRLYHFSPMTLRHERELLDAYEADDFRGLLFEAHRSLSGLAELMKNIDQEARLDGFAVYSLGRLLERASDLIFRMQDAYSTVELLEE